MTFEHFCFAVLAEITGAFIFLFLVLFLLKPRIKIADFICIGKFPQLGEENYYSFKFVNKSFFQGHEIKMELHKLERIPMGNKKINQKYTRLELLKDTILNIPARRFFWNKDNENLHCVVIRTTENINEILSVETNSVLLKISLKHGLTGLPGVYQMEYSTLETIKNGKFKSGTKFETL